MAVIHILAEVVVFFAAISLIYYVFQITQALGNRKRNLINVGIAVVVLAVAYPVSNLAGKKTVNPTEQISNQVHKLKQRHSTPSHHSSSASSTSSQSR